MIGRHFVAALMLGALAVPQTSKITIHLAGDSTMAEKLAEKRPETGWGEMLQQYLDTASVRVMNHARNGRSTGPRLGVTTGQALGGPARFRCMALQGSTPPGAQNRGAACNAFSGGG